MATGYLTEEDGVRTWEVTDQKSDQTETDLTKYPFGGTTGAALRC